MKTKTTAEDVADLVEYALNEVKPKIKTRRGCGNKVELKINRTRFVITIEKDLTVRIKNQQKGDENRA